MRKFILLCILIIACISVYSQDYFEDAQGNGFPIIVNTNGANFNARINSKDNSLKVNFFKFFSPKDVYGTGKTQFKDEDFVGTGMLLPRTEKPIVLPEISSSWGLGVSMKGKTEQNLGSIFSEGVFSSGFTAGTYIVHRKACDVSATSPKVNTWLFSAQYSASSLRLFDTSRMFEKMKIDTNFNAFSTSISFFQMRTIKKSDNLIWGASLEFARKNNYSSLKTYEVKDFEKEIIDPSSNTTRSIQISDEDGYGYSINNYKEKNYLTFRPHINYIPKFLNHRVGFIFYPSYVIVEKDKPRTNFELAFHLLEQGIPSLSNFAIYFSLIDVANNRGIENKTFIQRSFSIGVGAAFNMFTGKQK